MRMNSNYKVIFLSLIILVGILSISIGYSAFTSKLSIGKIATGVRIKKDVRVTDVSIINESSSDVLLNDLNYSVNSIITNIKFNNTSSYAMFKVTISNIGNQEIGIYNINVPEGIGYEIPKDNNYNLKEKICDSKNACSLGISKEIDIKIYPTSEVGINLENIKIDFDFRPFNKITYSGMNVYDTYPTEVIDGGDLSITFKEDLKRVEINSNNVQINYFSQITNEQTITLQNITDDIEIKKLEPPVKLVSGDLDTVGSVVAIGKEQFYVIGQDEENVKLLSMYNLNVGTYDTGEFFETENGWLTFKPYPDPTGIQDSEMKGCIEGEYPCEGVTQFSDVDSKYSGSIVEGYVNNYKNYLISLGVDNISARLITIEELIDLGCSWNEQYRYGECAETPKWVYSTTYWTGSQMGDYSVWGDYVLYIINFVDEDKGSLYAESYNFFEGNGVRPVIEIPLSEF